MLIVYQLIEPYMPIFGDFYANFIMLSLLQHSLLCSVYSDEEIKHLLLAGLQINTLDVICFRTIYG